VEIIEEAVEAAKENAALNHLDNCEFLAGDVLKVLDTIEERPDYIVLDPPRDGIHPKALEKIINYGVDHMIYISCKPTSLARDLEVLLAREYCAWKKKRLPTTNEWEYVALSPFKSQTDIKNLILEWYGRGAEWPLPHVKKNSSNKLGIYDQHGLIWEWVEDFNTSLVTGESRADGGLDKNLFCGAGASGAADPTDYAAFMRFAFRSSLQARYTVQNLGFRCARSKE
jgi:hypothetical protein